MNEFSTWLTERIDEWEFDLIGQYTLDRLATEVAKLVPANKKNYEYPRRTIIGKPLPYELETNTFPLMKLESNSVTVPIMGLSADIQISIDAYNGTESEYGEEWKDAFDMAMSRYMMEMQDKVENGIAGRDGEVFGLWNNDQLPAQNAPAILDPENPPITPEEGAQFLAFLDTMANSVGIASKHFFKADTMIIPSELERIFDRSIPQYGNMAGSTARKYLQESHGITLEISYNARRYNGGQILVYQRGQARYFLAQPVEILQDDKVVIRSGNNLQFPIRGRFSGVDFKQPLAGQYWNHVLTPVVVLSAKDEDEALTPAQKRANTIANNKIALENQTLKEALEKAQADKIALEQENEALRAGSGDEENNLDDEDLEDEGA